jgi:FkbM family methyltransferase
MNVGRLVKKCRAGYQLLRGRGRPSFSQAGEDILVAYLLAELRIDNVSYLDIGTNHPVLGNNTFYFYNRGGRGVCVEANKSICRKIRRARPRDTVINAGVSAKSGSADLFVFPDPYSGWNSFSEKEAIAKQQETGISWKAVIQVPLVSINQVLDRHFPHPPHFISLDVEGLDLEILKSLDFEKFKPEVICVETVNFSKDHKEVKNASIIEWVSNQGYFLYADTHINSIFCRTAAYKMLET